jgi:signal peptidase
MSPLAASLPRTSALSEVVPRALRIADRASSLICGLALAVLAVLLLAMASGYRPLIDHSDSMAPAIRAGDVVITHVEPASGFRRGDVVSFSDPALHGKLVTHRVVGIQASGGRIDFLTRGDANSAPESWSVSRSASLGKLVLRVPDVGRAMAWMADR